MFISQFPPQFFSTSLGRFSQNFPTRRVVSWNIRSPIMGVHTCRLKIWGAKTHNFSRFLDQKSAFWALPFPNAGKIGKSKTIGSIGGHVRTSIPNMVGFHHPTSEIGCPLGVWGGAVKLWIDITSAVWQLATRCLILGVCFRVKLSSKDIARWRI